MAFPKPMSRKCDNNRNKDDNRYGNKRHDRKDSGYCK
jgi:hypothetical protein